MALLQCAPSFIVKLPPKRRAPPCEFTRKTKTSVAHILWAKKRDEDRKQKDTSKRLSFSKENGDENATRDIAKRLSLSNKDKALSALSQPSKKQKAISALSQPSKNRRATMKRSNSQKKSSSLLPPPESKKSKKKSVSKREKTPSFSSLLPPPLPSLKSQESASLSSGLSSWEEFLGRAHSDNKGDENRLLQRPGKNAEQNKTTTLGEDENLEFPSISDLFPPDLRKESPSEQSLDGVLPVSELFYRSSQAMTGEDKEETEANEVDDEELPFSAEQSDELTTDGNKVKIRRNLAEATHDDIDDQQATKTKEKSTSKKRNRGRKLVRRGMEMFIGGTQINADPPQRSIELTYREGDPDNWASVITLNTRDFGSLLHTGSAESVSRVELGLFCENFVSAAMKWNVCPKDLREIVKRYMLQQESPSPSKGEVAEEVNAETATSTSSINVEYTNGDFAPDTDVREKKKLYDENNENNKILSLLRNFDETENETEKESGASKGKQKTNSRKSAAKGFGKKTGKSRAGGRRRIFDIYLQFSIGVSKEELESGDSRDAAASVMRGVLTRGITTYLKSELDGLMVRINKLKLKEGDDGATTVMIDFSLDEIGDVSLDDIEKRATRIDAAFDQVIDYGEFALALAAAAKEETAWPKEVRDRIVEEILLDDDDVNIPWEGGEAQSMNGAMKSNPKLNQSDDFNVASGKPEKWEDDLFSHEGAFFDYSESNAANAPFKGELGPLLVDAVTARAFERPPRVIAIGDVHGCIDELQDLLRLCDYRPGDQVIFLGDLVSKGPDSISVVQMAREIGAIAVRGNHDFEVIRWHQAIKAGKMALSRAA